MNSTKNKTIISNTQFWALLACMIWPTVIGYGAGIMARQVGRDIWISGIIALLTTVFFAYILVLTGRKFPDRSMVEYSRELIGKIPGKALGLGLFFYFLLAAGQSVSIYVHHIIDFLLPETPFMVIAVIHVLVISYIVWHGPEVIARVTVIGFFMAVVFTILVFLATLQEIDLHRIFPLFDHGLPATGAASLIAGSFIGQCLPVIAMLLPLVKDKKNAARSAITGLTVGGVLFIFYLISELMVMGPHVTALMRIACMDLVRSVQITEYLHRFESFMLALWYWSMLTQGGILAYCATLAFRQTLGVKKPNKWLVIATGIILASLTYFTAFNRITFLSYLEHLWQYISLPVQYGLPLMLFALSLFVKPEKAGE